MAEIRSRCFVWDFVSDNREISIAIAMECGVGLRLQHGWTGYTRMMPEGMAEIRSKWFFWSSCSLPLPLARLPCLRGTQTGVARRQGKLQCFDSDSDPDSDSDGVRGRLAPAAWMERINADDA